MSDPKTKTAAKGKVNKAAEIRNMLTKNPSVTFSACQKHFKDTHGLEVAGAQFYSIRNDLRSGGTKKKTTTAKKATTSKQTKKHNSRKTVAVAAKATTVRKVSCDASDIFKAQSVMLEAMTQAYDLVGQDRDALDSTIESAMGLHLS